MPVPPIMLSRAAFLPSRKSATASLENKRAAQLKVTAAEATLRQMRLKRFDAEDAAVKAVDTGEAKQFAEYADLFPAAAEEIAKLTGQNDELDPEMQSYEAKKNPTYSGEPNPPIAPAKVEPVATGTVAADATAKVSELPDGDIRSVIDAARKYAESHFANKTVTNKDDGSQILIALSGIKHALSSGAGRLDALAATDLENLIVNAKHQKSEPDKQGRKEIKSVHRYAATLDVAGEIKKIGVIVREPSDGRRYYAHFELRQKDASPLGTSGETSPGISDVLLDQPAGGDNSSLATPAPEVKADDLDAMFDDVLAEEVAKDEAKNAPQPKPKNLKQAIEKRKAEKALLPLLCILGDQWVFEEFQHHLYVLPLLDSLAQAQMEQLMEDLKSLGLIGDVVRKGVDLPVARPACWHNPLRDRDSDSSRIPRHLKLDYRTKPQRIKDFLRNLLNLRN